MEIESNQFGCCLARNSYITFQTMGSRREPDTDLNSIVFSCTPAHLKDFFVVVQKRAREKFWLMRETEEKKRCVQLDNYFDLSLKQKKKLKRLL